MKEEQFIRLPKVMELVGVQKSAIWKWIGEGTFPKQLKLTPRVSVWKLSEVQEWMDKQIEMHG